MRSVMHRLGPTLIGVAVVGASFAPRAASACSIAAPPNVIDTMPRDGATGVPLDVRPIIVGNLTSLDVRAGDGGAVAFDVDERSQAVIVTFDGLLAPQTTYTLEMGGDIGVGDATLTFTTGTAELGVREVPAVSDLTLEGLVAENASTWVYMCSTRRNYLCVGAAVPEEHTLVVGARTRYEGVNSFLLTPGSRGAYAYPSGFYDMNAPGELDDMASFIASEWESGTCVSAYLQDLAGNRGPERELCPGDFPVHRPTMLTSIACDGGQLDFEDDPGALLPGGEPPLPPEEPPDPPSSDAGIEVPVGTGGSPHGLVGPPNDGGSEHVPTGAGGTGANEQPEGSHQGIDTTSGASSGCTAAPGRPLSGSGMLVGLLALGLFCRRRVR